MDDARIERLNDADADHAGTYVLYWMQQSQRTKFNHALEHAVRLANDRGQSVVVGFGLTPDYPEANERHFAFMLEGLSEVARDLAGRGLKFVVRKGSPDQVALHLAKDASLVVCDRGYLRHQRAWRRRVAEEAGKLVVQVESDVVVPVERVSDKVEYAARTIRPKVSRLWDDHLTGLTETRPRKQSKYLDIDGGIDLSNPDTVLDGLEVDRSVRRSRRFKGGTDEARRRLAAFLRGGLQGYDESRNDPAAPQCSHLSPYLHFGQISPVEIALKVRSAKSGTQADGAAFLEELIVRRELAANFVHYADDYDRYDGLPGWAKKTLADHRDDERPRRYTRKELAAGKTHDAYWNAAMQEMRETGYMHNHMRMYWGKKILEWSNTPEYAYATALHLNNKYFLDGRDPNSFANVGWLFGLHDRPWQERPIFGKVRYMSAAGLERKFDIEGYVERVRQLA